MLKMKNRDSNYWFRDHVSRNKFCFDINWTNNSTLNISKCLVLQNRINAKFYEGLISIYDVNCLLECNALAQKQY